MNSEVKQAIDSIKDLMANALIINLLTGHLYLEKMVAIATVEQSLESPLSGFKDANHFRNAFYNAPIGTVEHEIANKLNRLVELEERATPKELIEERAERDEFTVRMYNVDPYYTRLKCPSCNETGYVGSRFCPYCGQALKGGKKQ